MLLIYGDERVWASLGRDDMERVYAAHRAYGEALTKAGALVGGAELQPVASATTVRFTGGRPRTTDGPFAETKEQLAGYYVIDVDHLDQAIAWAEQMPGMTDGTVEIRPYAPTE
ncbi:MAG: YciI family protein [Vicinamibacterales bacterium]